MVFGFYSKCDGKSLEGLSREVSDEICFIIFKVYCGYCVKPVLGGSGDRGEAVRDAYNGPGKPHRWHKGVAVR